MANCFRVSPKLDKRLIELIVLLVCRDATAQYAWSAHFNLAREAGLSGHAAHRVSHTAPLLRLMVSHGRRADEND